MAACRILTALLLGVLLVPRAHAAGISLRWDHCFGDAGLANKSFACNTNLGGIETLAGSFVLPAALTQVAGVQMKLEITTASASLPAWWAFFNSGTCRQTSLSNAQITPAPAIACVDWSAGIGSAVVASYSIGAFGPSTAAVTAYTAVAAASVADLSAGQEYSTGSLRINHQKTVGLGSCAGCSTPACIYLRSVEVFLLTGTTAAVTLTSPVNGTDANTATWQSGAGVPALPGGACSGAVPVRASTWGEVKSLYR